MMRILIVGAGGVGGYFGARLLAAGRDVTFLVRPRRAGQLARDGLVVRSPHGDLKLSSPPTISADELGSRFDLILLSCKAYDLEDAMEAFGAAVGPGTSVLPLLNGMRHLDLLDRRFGPDAVLGGYGLISSTVDAEGQILHLADLHTLVFGERRGGLSARADEINRQLNDAGFDCLLSESILQEMWEKWVFIATLAGATCLMRASVGTVLEAGGGPFVRALLEECASIAASKGFPPGKAPYERSLGMVTAEGSGLKASMLHDIERGARTEGAHILGDLLRRATRGAGVQISPLELACTHVAAYEKRRAERGPPSAG